MPNIVVPNDVEGFGLVSLEAAVRATVVVAADLQGIPEAVHDGSNGFLVRPGDAEAYAAKIAEILALADAERRAIGEQFRVYTADNLSWGRAARAYRNCFEETVEAYRRRKELGTPR
jgi:phosphatidylinositol alpha-1,6-mannosyltransferase